LLVPYGWWRSLDKRYGYREGLERQTADNSVVLRGSRAKGHGQRKSIRRIISAAKAMLSRNAISRAGEGLPASAVSFRAGGPIASRKAGL